MSQQDGGFGKRGMRTAGETPRPISTPTGDGMSPLVKQIGGMALGVALAFAIGGAGSYFMKQAGKSLDRNFVVRANPGNPAAAIEQVGGGDAQLQRVHRICTDRAATAGLTETQKRATDATDSLSIVEHRVARAGAYVACLTTEQPQRFCQKPQRQHLFEAVRQYAKLVIQAREEWQIQKGSPAMAVGGRPVDFNQLAAIGMPSVRMDPQLEAGMTALDTNGYIPVGEIAQLVSGSASNRMPGGFGGAPSGMPQMPQLGGSQTNVQTRKAACG